MNCTYKLVSLIQSTFILNEDIDDTLFPTIHGATDLSGSCFPLKHTGIRNCL